MSHEFVVAVSPLLKVKVDLRERDLSWKVGLRKRSVVPLEDVSWFGHRRLAGGATGVVELVFVSKSGAKLPRLPMNPSDPGVRRLLDALAVRLPDADTTRLSWLDAAPLLGIKPYGVGAYLRYPLFAAGLALLLLGGPASFLSQRVLGSSSKYQGIAIGVVMVAGLVMMVLGWQRVRAAQRTEEKEARRRAA